MTERLDDPQRADKSHDEPLYRWQVKLLGYYWCFSVASWENWHRPDLDPRVRRAWWWLWRFNRDSRSCFRICGLTLESKQTPYIDYSRYGV